MPNALAPPGRNALAMQDRYGRFQVGGPIGWQDVKGQGFPGAEILADIIPFSAQERAIDHINTLLKEEGMTPIRNVLNKAEMGLEGAGLVADILPGVKAATMTLGPLVAAMAQRGGRLSKLAKAFQNQQGIIGYHGSPVKGLKTSDIDPRKAVETEGVSMFTDSEDIASQFTYPREYGELVTESPTGQFDEFGQEIWEEIEAGPILKADIDFKNPFTLTGDDAQRAIDDTIYQGEVIRKAKAAGHDGVVFKDITEFADPSARGNVYAVFDKSAIKSIDEGDMKILSRNGEALLPEMASDVPALPEGYRRFYNAGTFDRDPQGYLEPHISGWVEEVAAGAGDVPIEDITSPLVYMDEKPGWVRSIVARKLGKNNADVTLDDIRKHGRLNIIDVDPEYSDIYQSGDYFYDQKVTDIDGNRIPFYESSIYDEGDVYTGEGRLVEIPVGPEPNDWISNQPQEIVKSLTGDDLINYLRSQDALDDDLIKQFDALPLDEASRMGRAREMGDTGKDWYHGVTWPEPDGDFSSFREGGATFFVDNPETASNWTGSGQSTREGSRVIPARLTPKNTYDFDADPLDLWSKYNLSMTPGEVGWSNIDAVEDMRKLGFDSYKWTEWAGDVPETNMAVFDPANIRSKFAKFDPAKKGSADILAGTAAGAIGLGLYADERSHRADR